MQFANSPSRPAAAHDHHGQPLVRFESVQKSYDGESFIIKGLDLEIGAGEFLTMLGPSGSGKTTSLMMLAGFETPTSGTIWMGERQLNNVPPHKRDIGVVFQNYALFPHMTVAENIGYPLWVRRMPKKEIAVEVDHALEMVQLGKLGKRYPAQLSGGQQQRVALARALVAKPQLVLMDEPLGALDRQLREHMQIEIKHLHERLNVTIVYVTHDQGEALTMSDRVAVFNNGFIQQIAAPRELYENPGNSFVAGFIGENNTLEGVVVEICGDHCVVATDLGNRIAARVVNVATVGERTSVSIRPENISLHSPGSMQEPGLAPHGEHRNHMQVQVVERIYLGDQVRIRIAMGQKNDIIVKLPTWSEKAHVNPGDRLIASWKAEDCLALDHT